MFVGGVMMGKTQNVWAKCIKFWISCVCYPRPVHAYYLHPHVTYFDIMIYYVMALALFRGGGASRTGEPKRRRSQVFH